MDVLAGWEGREVLVVAFVAPGFSLLPMRGRLALQDAGGSTVRAAVSPCAGEPVRIAFPVATFHEAAWVSGHEGRGLSITQGATRVDIFCED